MKKLIDLEVALHKKQPHQGSEPLSALLHDEFLEIGRSGQAHRVKDAAAWLDSDQLPGAEICSHGFECSMLAEGMALMTYNTVERSSDGSLQKHARRSSLWQKVNGRWKMRFHQATAVEGFD